MSSDIVTTKNTKSGHEEHEGKTTKDTQQKMKQGYLTGQVKRKIRVQGSGGRKILNHEDYEEKTGGRGFRLGTDARKLSGYGKGSKN